MNVMIDMFNIYYINFPKVYELKMMINNIVQLGGEVQSNDSKNKDVDYSGKLGFKFMQLFDTSASVSRKNSSLSSQKVLETFEVKTTKSLILSDVVRSSKSVKTLADSREGEVIQLKNIRLTLLNEAELRTVKLFMNGNFKGMPIPGVDGVDMSSLIDSMVKDYSYKLEGTLEDSKEKVVIKIPLTFENEFESSYSIDDLLIGNVTLLGVYKGKILRNALKNSFEFFQQLNAAEEVVQESFIESSQVTNNDQTLENALFSPEPADGKIHYIDLLAIVQNIELKIDENDSKPSS